MADNTKYVGGQKYKLAGSGATLSDTSLVLLSFYIPGTTTALTMTDFGSVGYGTLEPGTSKAEFISFTGVTANGDGTWTLTGVTRGLKFNADYTADSSLRKAHAGGSIFVISNTPQFYDTFVNKANDETITGTYTFSAKPTFSLGADMGSAKITNVATPVDNTDAATKAYADAIASAGAADANTTTKGLVEEATQAEIDADTAAGGTSARLAVNPSTLATSKYGTRLPTADQKAALAGTSGSPSVSNKYVTNDDVAAAATANKVARRNATGDITVSTTPSASTDAASKSYVDGVTKAVVGRNNILVGSAGNNRYAHITGGDIYTSVTAATGEPDGFLVPFSCNATVLYAKSGGVVSSTSSTLTLRKNGADTALTISWTTGQTNTVKSATGSVSLSAGDRLTYFWGSVGTGDPELKSATLVLVPV